jgi:hypothetical protein
MAWPRSRLFRVVNRLIAGDAPSRYVRAVRDSWPRPKLAPVPGSPLEPSLGTARRMELIRTEVRCILIM